MSKDGFYWKFKLSMYIDINDKHHYKEKTITCEDGKELIFESSKFEITLLRQLLNDRFANDPIRDGEHDKLHVLCSEPVEVLVEDFKKIKDKVVTEEVHEYMKRAFFHKNQQDFQSFKTERLEPAGPTTATKVMEVYKLLGIDTQKKRDEVLQKAKKKSKPKSKKIKQGIEIS